MEEVVIQNDALHDVATYKLFSNGKELDPSLQLMSLSVSKELNRVPVAKITIRDGNAADQKFEISEQEHFAPGKKITIELGRDGIHKKAFHGIIVKHSIKVKAKGNTHMQIECMDEAVKMTMGRCSKYFEKKYDHELFDELIEKYPPLKSEPEKTKLKHKEIVQHNISDWDFMLLRAEANGKLVNVDDGIITIAKPAVKKEAMQINFGSSVMEFEAEMDARTQLKEVKAQSWDYATQELFTSQTSSTPFKEHGNIKGSDIAEVINPTNYEVHHSGHKSEQELKDWTEGLMMRSRLSKIRGRARFTGSASIKPGDTVKISGVGDRFNGLAFVTAVRHDFGNGTWETQIQFGLDSKRYSFIHNDVNDAASAGLVGAIHGLQIGKVVKLENDPDGEDRIFVRVPVINAKEHGIWTRVASLDAGKDRGAFFMPEKGDEVIIGFINDDPRDAVILGMLHSSNKPAPITPKDDNDEKGFTTRSKMHISFNDKENSIKIDTPAGNSITLSEKEKKIEIKDQSQNKITMEPKGITMESPANIDIKAGAVLTLAGGTSLSIGAPSLSVKADVDVTIQGSMAKLNGSSMTEIKGGMVMIN